MEPRAGSQARTIGIMALLRSQPSCHEGIMPSCTYGCGHRDTFRGKDSML